MIYYNYHFLFQLEPPPWWGWIAFILMVGTAIVVLAQRRRDEIHKTDVANVNALKGLLETRDRELAQATKDLAVMTTEYKALAQVNIKELIGAWTTHTASHYYAENAAIKRECEELRLRLARWEKV